VLSDASHLHNKDRPIEYLMHRVRLKSVGARLGTTVWGTLLKSSKIFNF